MLSDVFATRAIRTTLGALPTAVVERLRFVSIEHREWPSPVDLKRGVEPDHRGYFFGHMIERSDDAETELPDEDPPRGTIVIFTGRIEPLTVTAIAKILLHEIGHALGYDHDVLIDELRLA